jgi:hypothetical protein
VVVRIRLVFALAVAVAALASPASGAEQLKRHSIAGEGVSLGVPNSWVAISAKDLLTGAALDRLARDNPNLAPFIRAFAQAGSPVKFVALDPALRGGFATNVNVVAVRIGRAVTFEEYRQALLSELRVLTRGGKIEQSVVRVGGERAVRVSFRFKLTAGRTFTVQTLQYGFLRQGKSIVFTYSTVPRFASAYAQAFRASASSIRFAR